MPIDMAKRALRLASRDLSVLPMHSTHLGRCTCSQGNACERAGKHPITPHGVNDATTKRDQIKSWWTASPDANIGIATGAVSSIIVLDIDPRNGGIKRLKRLKKELGSLPDTVTGLTGGGGLHLVFKYPSFAVRKDTSGKKFGRGVDILSDGCIMVAPPSRHATGERYRWKEGKSFRDLKPATLPRNWLDRLRRDGSADSGKDNRSQTDGRVLEGQRNNFLTSLAGTLQRSGASPAAITAALFAENKAKCSPPLDKSEIEKIAASITKYAPISPIGDGADDAERLMQLVLERNFNRGKHLLLGTDGRFWHYDIRLWRPVSDQWVSRMVLETIEANPVKKQNTASLIGQVLTVLKAKVAVKDDVLALLWQIFSGRDSQISFSVNSWAVGFWRADHEEPIIGLGSRACPVVEAVLGALGPQGAAANVPALRDGVDWTRRSQECSADGGAACARQL